MIWSRLPCFFELTIQNHFRDCSRSVGRWEGILCLPVNTLSSLASYFFHQRGVAHSLGYTQPRWGSTHWFLVPGAPRPGGSLGRICSTATICVQFNCPQWILCWTPNLLVWCSSHLKVFSQCLHLSRWGPITAVFYYRQDLSEFSSQVSLVYFFLSNQIDISPPFAYSTAK